MVSASHEAWFCPRTRHHRMGKVPRNVGVLSLAMWACAPESQFVGDIRLSRHMCQCTSPHGHAGQGSQPGTNPALPHSETCCFVYIWTCFYTLSLRFSCLLLHVVYPMSRKRCINVEKHFYGDGPSKAPSHRFQPALSCVPRVYVASDN